MSSPPEFALSTWSLHRALGIAFPDAPETPGNGEPVQRWGKGEFSLAELPARMKQRGFARLEICHFHINRRDKASIAEMRAALKSAGVTLQSLLIDAGDITDPVTRQRDLAWIAGWIEAAAELGAETARVIGGKQKPDAAALAFSIKGLRACAALGRRLGVAITTENWFDTLGTPESVAHVFDALGGDVRFLADTGNWKGTSKYAGLEAIFARAGYCHAKAHFDESLIIDAEDFRRCIAAAKAAGYAGPFTIVYDSANADEWHGIEATQRFIEAAWR